MFPRLTVENVETYMVVMRNVFSSHMKVHKKYDLKGSTIDREVSWFPPHNFGDEFLVPKPSS